jgi:hypothetical protein
MPTKKKETGISLDTFGPHLSGWNTMCQSFALFFSNAGRWLGFTFVAWLILWALTLIIYGLFGLPLNRSLGMAVLNAPQLGERAFSLSRGMWWSEFYIMWVSWMMLAVPFMRFASSGKGLSISQLWLWPGRRWRLFLYGFFFSIIIGAMAFLAFMVDRVFHSFFQAAGASAPEMGFELQVVIIISMIIVFYFLGRWMLFPAVIARDKELPFAESFRLMRGHVWQFYWGLFLQSIVLFIVMWFLTALFYGWIVSGLASQPWSTGRGGALTWWASSLVPLRHVLYTPFLYAYISLAYKRLQRDEP